MSAGWRATIGCQPCKTIDVRREVSYRIDRIDVCCHT